ncbi:efflux RND transporter periplasmic adaptor subunit [Candidatus Daviesbacteria bacterium]|nr:efflux RND transporter periplasmic adaptor subunit [Candidatus Daviesbacteria bacterium]
MKIFNSRKVILLLIIIVVLSFIGYNSIFQKKTPSLQFTQVKKGDIKSTVSSSGILTGKNEVNLKFRSSGKLAYVNVSEGEKVSAGQAIAGLDTRDLSIKLSQAENTLKDKQATAQKIEDDVKDHDKDETFTQKANRTTAQAARDSAFDGVKEARRAFGDAVLVSPISGVVTQAVSVSGQNVSSSDTIAQIVDFSEIFFDTDIDETDISKISQGQSAQVSLDAYPDKNFAGTVSEIIPQTKTTSSGATVITTRINLSNPSINPIKGLSGQASIILSEAKNVLILPSEAVRDDNTVFVQTAQGLKVEKVETGIKSDTNVEVKKGLKVDENVLLNPPASGIRVNQQRSLLQSIIFRIRR